MSIWGGKDGYSSVADFTQRTREELQNQGGVIFRRDTEPPEHEKAWVREQLTRHRRVLELGCGLGPWADVAEECECEYVGIDPVPERIAYAREHHPTGAFNLGDAKDIRLVSRDFDAVLFVTVLQHMTLTDAILALKTAELHLVVGGEVILIESMLLEKTLDECEQIYALETTSDHMIPKPVPYLKNLVPRLSWSQVGGDRYILTKS